MPRLAKQMGIAPFTGMSDRTLVPIEYGTLTYFVNRMSGLTQTQKALAVFGVGFAYENVVLQ